MLGGGPRQLSLPAPLLLRWTQVHRHGQGEVMGATGEAGSACSLLCFLLEFQLNKRLCGGVCSVPLQHLQPLETCLKILYMNTDGRVAQPFLPGCILEFE